MAKKTGKEMMYISTPFTHEDPEVEKQRVEEAEDVTCLIIRYWEDYVVPFCPIAYTGRLQKKLRPNINWLEFDKEFLKLFDSVMVVKMEGWEESVGVNYEIDLARKERKEILYVSPNQIMAMLRQRYRGI